MDAPARGGFTAWHAATIALLALGYSGYYFCRSNLSVVLPDLMQDLSRHGVTLSEAQVRLGFIASAGTMAYAAGKFISGSVADLFGGRRNFLAGMGGSIFFTVLFLASGGISAVHAGVDREPAVSIGGMGGPGESRVALVFIFHLWNRDGGAQSEFSVRRRGLPLGDGAVDGPRRGLAGCIYGGGGVPGGAAGGQCVAAERNAGGARTARAGSEPAECVRRRREARRRAHGTGRDSAVPC